MTRTDEFIERLEEYLDEYEGITPLPDALRDAIRAELPKTRQARPLTGLARFTDMNSTVRYGIAAAAIAIAAIFGFSYLNGNVGGPTPSPDSTPTPDPVPSDGAAQEESLWPEELQRPFVGPGDGLPGEWGIQQAEFRVSGRFFEYFTTDGTVFQATASMNDSGHLTLRTIGDDECTSGDEGRYTYELSPGGNVLRLTGEDDCTVRGAALTGGEWLRSVCRDNSSCLGALEPGSYSSAYFDPRPQGTFGGPFGALTYEVPSGWANYADFPQVYGLTPQTTWDAFEGGDCFDCEGTRDAVTLLATPGAAPEDCAVETPLPEVGPGMQEMLDWMQQHPGLVLSGIVQTEISGRAAASFFVDLADDWTGTCADAQPVVAVPIFVAREGGYHWALAASDRWHVTLIDLGGDETVAVVVDSAEVSGLDALVEAAEPIMATFSFPEG